MAPLKQKLLEDRALRDAARQIVTTDVEFLKTEVEQQGVPQRLLGSGSEYARTIAIGAKDLAADNRAKVAGGVALAVSGIAAWLCRDHIMEAVNGFFDQPQDIEPESDLPEQSDDGRIVSAN